jgi:maltose O-acetyltransferase
VSVSFRAAELLVGRLPPFVASRVRSQALRAAGVRLGATSIFWDFPTLLGRVEQLQVGESCGFNTGCFFDLEASLVLEDHVSVGHDVMFLTRSYEPGSAHQRAGAMKAAPILVKKGAWLGARCTVLPGVTIGEGAVIGASVVVDKAVPAQTLVMGQQRISLAKWRTPGG